MEKGLSAKLIRSDEFVNENTRARFDMLLIARLGDGFHFTSPQTQFDSEEAN